MHCLIRLLLKLGEAVAITDTTVGDAISQDIDYLLRVIDQAARLAWLDQVIVEYECDALSIG